MPGIQWTDHEVILPSLAGKSRVLVHVDYFRNQSLPSSSPR
jgi:hypothetical protein